jgi:hypothetical protein
MLGWVNRHNVSRSAIASKNEFFILLYGDRGHAYFTAGEAYCGLYRFSTNFDALGAGILIKRYLPSIFSFS